VFRKGEDQEGGTINRQERYESSLKSAFRGAVNQPPFHFSAFKIGQKEPALVSPCIHPAGSLRSPVARQGPSSSSCIFP
jgi:hypothetical protein